MIAILFELVEAPDADTSAGQWVVMMAEGSGVVVVVIVFVVVVVVVVRSVRDRRRSWSSSSFT